MKALVKQLGVAAMLVSILLVTGCQSLLTTDLQGELTRDGNESIGSRAQTSPTPAKVLIATNSVPVKYAFNQGIWKYTGGGGLYVDTGFLPNNLPFQIKLVTRATLVDTKIQLPGKINAAYPNWVQPGQKVPVEVWFTGDTSAGFFQTRTGLLFYVRVKINVPGLVQTEFNLSDVDLEWDCSTAALGQPFTPFLLAKSITVPDDAVVNFGVKDITVGFKGMNVITASLAVSLTGTAALVFGGKAIILSNAVNEKSIVFSNGSSISFTSEDQHQKAFVQVPARQKTGPWQFPAVTQYVQWGTGSLTLKGSLVGALKIGPAQLLKPYKSDPFTLFALSGSTDQTGNFLQAFQTAYFTMNVDGTLPSLSNAAVTPASLSKSGGPVTLSVNVQDAESGVGYVAARVTDSNGKVTEVALQLVSGTAASGTWRGTYNVSPNTTKYVEKRYSVQFGAKDAVGNTTPYATPQSPITLTVKP